MIEVADLEDDPWAGEHREGLEDQRSRREVAGAVAEEVLSLAQGAVEEVVIQEQGVSASIVELKCAKGTKMVKQHLEAVRTRYRRYCRWALGEKAR